jgi:hypothetical protein
MKKPRLPKPKSPKTKTAVMSKAGSHVKRVKRELASISSMVVEGMPSPSRLANLGKYAHAKKRS